MCINKTERAEKWKTQVDQLSKEKASAHCVTVRLLEKKLMKKKMIESDVQEGCHLCCRQGVIPYISNNLTTIE